MTSPKEASSAHRFSLDERALGILCHPTSLPGRFGAGDLGANARAFVDFAKRARARWWQMLPLGPVGHGGSPYSSTSVFAGNAWLIDIERLVGDGLLDASALPPERAARAGTDHDMADFAENERVRGALLAAAFAKAKPAGWHLAERRAFFEANAWWLADFALYAAIKKQHDGAPFFSWPGPWRAPDAAALATFARENGDAVELEIFLQYLFARDLGALHGYANERGVALMGDVPIFVAHDSADVWARPSAFQIDADGSLRAVAGVPPDAFSDEGQLWGNPLYDWDRLRATGYAFWIERVGHAMRGFDSLRLDHFIGFERYWAVPSGAKNAKTGSYQKGPGRELFAALRRALGDVPFVAEDLGVLTDEVRALRDGLRFPGMNVLEFSFSPSPSAEASRPHRYAKRSVVYTGTHDNDTLVGWLSDPPDDASKETRAHYADEQAFAAKYLDLNPSADAPTKAKRMIRAAMASQADLAIVPVQDLLCLGRTARMNRPGISDGNWAFRLLPDRLTDAVASELAGLAVLYGRAAGDWDSPV